MENYCYTPRCKITVIPLGLILTEKHDDLILYDVCHDYISVAWGHGLYYGGSVLVAMPQLSDLVALPQICHNYLIWWLCHIYLFWWLCHNICIW